jgi:hypothetical protein
MRRKTRIGPSWLGLLVLLALLLAACSSPAPNFNISLSPTSLTVQQGSSGNITLTLTPQNGFTGTVTLALVDASTGNAVPDITLSPTSFTVSTSSPTNQTLTVNVASSVATGSYNLKVKAVSGSLNKEANLSLTVSAAPDFSIALSPTSLTVQQGSSGNTTLTLTPQNGFTGTVTLALVDASTGNAVPDITLSPTSFTVSTSSPTNQTLTVNVASSVATGSYNLKVKAVSGSLNKEASLSLDVTAGGGSPDFSISLSPTSLTVQQGASGSTTLTLTPLNGFTGTVNLSLVGAPNGVTLSPASVTVSGTSPVTQNLTLTVGSSVAPNTYALQVKGTSGSITQQASLSLTVSAPGGGGGNTVTVRQTDSGPLLGAYYRVGSGSWQTLSFSNGQATFTATGDYEVAVRCESGPNVLTGVYLFKASTSQASTLPFACTSSGSSSRTFQVSLPTSIGSYTIQAGDSVAAGSFTATYTGSNPVTLQNVFFPDGSQDVLFTVFRGTGPTSVTPIGYKLVNLDLVGGGPFAVDATGWRPFAATRAIGQLNLPSGYQGGAGVFFFRNGMKNPTISGLLDRYGLLQEQGKYLGFVSASAYNDFLTTIKDTGGNDWTPSLMSPWGAGQFSVNDDTLTFTHPDAQFYQVSLDGFIDGLRAQITVYPSGGSTTYTVPVVPGLYTLADYSSRFVYFNLLAVRGSLAQLALISGDTAPNENNLSGLDLANALRRGSFSGASYTLP